jgi:hypothetical protein
MTLPEPFWPHALCLLHDPSLIGLHVLADGMIALAYFAIPSALAYFALKRRVFPFRGIVLWFAAFTVACGLTHVGNVVEMFSPAAYWITGAGKLITAALSWWLLRLLLPVLPQMLALPGLDQLDEVRQWMSMPVGETLPQMQAELDKLIDVLTTLTPPKAPER